jgi:hypothetical protein
LCYCRTEKRSTTPLPTKPSRHENTLRQIDR